MTYTIHADGWVTGSLPGPGGKLCPIEKHECPRPNNEPYRKLEKHPPDLLLHTTEGTDLDSAIATLRAKFSPSQWACGENRIAQLRPLWAQGAAIDTQNAYFMQVENVAQSSLMLWLPGLPTLNPLVALVAMLHREHKITTGLKRPPKLAERPLVLDRLPAAVSTYYRRSLAPEPAVDGIRGHVDSKDDEHWDPGSFNYPTFFTAVELVLGGADDVTPEQAKVIEDARVFLTSLRKNLGQLADPTKPATPIGAGQRVARSTKRAEAGGGSGGASKTHVHDERVTGPPREP